MNLREIEEGGLRFYEAKGRMNGELADGPDVEPCPHCGLVEDYDRDEPCPCLPVEPPCEDA